MADRIAVLRDGRLEQLATPQELYASPASRFVAGFIGSANLLDGVAVKGGVDVPQLGVIESPGRVAASEPATVVVRPEDVDLSPDAAAPGLRGTVVDTYFLGGMSTVSVQLASTGTLVLASVHGTTDLRRGDEVAVRFGRATAVARDESSSAQPEQLSGEPAAQEVSAWPVARRAWARMSSEAVA
jgi:spermidine/putrescine transport system ATP-binding protein/putrescine transport system ATP-binding protein